MLCAAAAAVAPEVVGKKMKELDCRLQVKENLPLHQPIGTVAAVDVAVAAAAATNGNERDGERINN